MSTSVAVGTGIEAESIQTQDRVLSNKIDFLNQLAYIAFHLLGAHDFNHRLDEIGSHGRSAHNPRAQAKDARPSTPLLGYLCYGKKVDDREGATYSEV